MKILVAPDSLKESLSAVMACEAIENGIRKIFPEAQLISVPMADGGEGTVQCLVRATQGKIITTTVHDPLMRKVEAFYGILGDRKTAVIEMAAASGLELLKKNERNPLKTTTFGTGELIRHALDQGCRKIIVGLGGSATNDGGAGMAMALGALLKDSEGNCIEYGGGNLNQLRSIDLTRFDNRIYQTSFIAACDVKNPLIGATGASRVFAKQKGADAKMVSILETNLQHYSDVILRELQISIAEVPGAGAAGGLGAGLMTFLNAKLSPGFALISDIINFESLVQKADLIVTAEGKADAQTLSGKVPFGIGLLGQKYGVPVFLFAGTVTNDAPKLYDYGITSVIGICNAPMSLEDALGNAGSLLEDSVATTFRVLWEGIKLPRTNTK